MPWWRQSIFIKWIALPLRFFSRLIWIATWPSSKVTSLSRLISSKLMTCDGSVKYFRSIDTQKMTCILANYGGKASLYATSPIHYSTSKGLIYRDESFPFFLKRMIPRRGWTFKNTWSPISKIKGLLLLSTFLFWWSWDAFNHCRISFTFSVVSRTSSGPTGLASPTSIQQIGD